MIIAMLDRDIDINAIDSLIPGYDIPKNFSILELLHGVYGIFQYGFGCLNCSRHYQNASTTGVRVSMAYR